MKRFDKQFKAQNLPRIIVIIIGLIFLAIYFIMNYNRAIGGALDALKEFY